MCMEYNGKDAKETKNISIIMHSVINGEGWNFRMTVWYEGGLQLENIGDKNVREYYLNPR